MYLLIHASISPIAIGAAQVFRLYGLAIQACYGVVKQKSKFVSRRAFQNLTGITGLFVMLTGCYRQERSCDAFKTGTFVFTATVDGVEKTTTFFRNDSLEIDYFEGKSDTSSVRWINDCEYIVKKINPKNMAEQKAIHMKILTTTDSTYTFEYGIVGSENKQRGTVKKMN